MAHDTEVTLKRQRSAPKAVHGLVYGLRQTYAFQQIWEPIDDSGHWTPALLTSLTLRCVMREHLREETPHAQSSDNRALCWSNFATGASIATAEAATASEVRQR